jgi:DNA polymerase III subunit gamma/tau
VAEPGGAVTAPYQFLYRRFRPQRFADVLGQDHVSHGLRTAVREGRVGHAYLFSGPRGTGKTSTARILAMALNCEHPSDGEPDGVCASCVEISQGSSLDVHELDAASNNGVDAMRDLVARAALGTPGRWKVYIVDEVHMLSTAASNALLKTLEEPPGHVVFVLATTDPQKVLPTVRSRTQHYEFRLLDPGTLVDLLARVAAEAGLELPAGALDAAVRRGRGSARDALSALDQIVAGGVVDDEAPVVAELAEALAERDTARALVGVAAALAAGLDPLRLAGELVEYLRQGFLVAVAPELVTVTGAERDRVAAGSARLGLPTLVRAMEGLGRAQIDMRDSPDTRVDLEVALIRLSHPEADADVGALAERVDRLERSLDGGGPGPSGAPPAAAPAGQPGAVGTAAAPTGAEPVGVDAAAGGVPSGRDAESPGGPGLARQALGAVRARGSATGGTAGRSAPADRPPAGDRPTPSDRPARGTRPTASSDRPGAGEADGPGDGDGQGSGDGPGAARTSTVDAPPAALRPLGPPRTGTVPSRDDLVQTWGDGILQSLPDRARARFRAGRWTDVVDGRAVFALPNERHRSYCEVARPEVETRLQQHFGVPIGVDLVVDDESGGPAAPTAGSPPASDDAPPPSPPTGSEDEDDTDYLDPVVLAARTDPAGAGLSPAERLKQLFPGAEEV